MCSRCIQKSAGTADSQDAIALGSGLHGDFAAMTFVLHTAKLQKTTRILLSKLWNSRGNSLCHASVHFPTAIVKSIDHARSYCKKLHLSRTLLTA